MTDRIYIIYVSIPVGMQDLRLLFEGSRYRMMEVPEVFDYSCRKNRRHVLVNRVSIDVTEREIQRVIYPSL